ncbi:MAG TPA: large-conductance mechanosensitive channel protein MscL [Polyangiaceae bacterium]
MSILKEFREFAVKGNVVDLAVGVIIGGAFGKIVSSVVADIVMPPLGLLIGGVDFKHLKVVLREPADPKDPGVVLAYGQFMQNVFDFLIVAVAVFLLVKLLNRLKRESEAPAADAMASVPRSELLLEEIRDLLKAQRRPLE